jgi:glutamine amidotransferase
MCHLFAISSSDPTTIAPFAAALAPFSEKESPHGWGLAAINADRTSIIKEPRRFATALGSGSAEVARALRTAGETILFHMRDASVGKNSIDNTHPFRRHFLKRTFLFMHNGTVPEVKKLPLSRLERAGQTDSEHAFLWFLEAMPPVPPRNLALWLKGESDLIRRLGKFNFVMAEGGTLWAYADTALFYAERRSSPAQRAARSGGAASGPRGSARSRAAARTERLATERMVLVATCPFTTEDRWRPLATGNLLVARGGRVVEVID